MRLYQTFPPLSGENWHFVKRGTISITLAAGSFAASPPASPIKTEPPRRRVGERVCYRTFETPFCTPPEDRVYKARQEETDGKDASQHMKKGCNFLATKL